MNLYMLIWLINLSRLIHARLIVYQTQQLDEKNGAIQSVDHRDYRLIIPSSSKVTPCDGDDVQKDVGIDRDFVLGTM